MSHGLIAMTEERWNQRGNIKRQVVLDVEERKRMASRSRYDN
jgi:hypothetical protein